MELYTHAILALGLLISGLLVFSGGVLGAWLTKCEDALFAGFMGFGAAIFVMGVMINP